MYKVTDNFYDYPIFLEILNLVKDKPFNELPENYDGKRCSYGKSRQQLTKDSILTEHILTQFPYKEKYKRRIEIANDVNGFWLKPHSDHSAKKQVAVIYLEGQEGTTFHYDDGDETVDFIPNRAVFFDPDTKDTYDSTSWKHSVRKIDEIRRTVVVNYVDDTWNDTWNCYDR